MESVQGDPKKLYQHHMRFHFRIKIIFESGVGNTPCTTYNEHQFEPGAANIFSWNIYLIP